MKHIRILFYEKNLRLTFRMLECSSQMNQSRLLGNDKNGANKNNYLRFVYISIMTES